MPSACSKALACRVVESARHQARRFSDPVEEPDMRALTIGLPNSVDQKVKRKLSVFDFS
jgi:hypothetical protein